MTMKKKEKTVFDKFEVKLVMRAYGVTRDRALQILAAKHAGEEPPAGSSGRRIGSPTVKTGDDDDEFMSAEEFFGI